MAAALEVAPLNPLSLDFSRPAVGGGDEVGYEGSYLPQRLRCSLDLKIPQVFIIMINRNAQQQVAV